MTRVHRSRTCLSLALLATLSATSATAAIIGESLIDRPFVDTASGDQYLYNGLLPDGERLLSFSFFNNNLNNQNWITPLLLDTVGAFFRVVGIGESVQNTGLGIQTVNFNLQVGTDLITDTDFVFGWWNGRIDGATFIPNTGVIEFTAANTNPGFRESCPSPNVGPCNLNPTTLFAIPFNNNYTVGPNPGSFGAPNGRIYSASVTTGTPSSSAVPEPSSYALMLAGAALLVVRRKAMAAQ